MSLLMLKMCIVCLEVCCAVMAFEMKSWVFLDVHGHSISVVMETHLCMIVDTSITFLQATFLVCHVLLCSIVMGCLGMVSQVMVFQVLASLVCLVLVYLAMVYVACKALALTRGREHEVDSAVSAECH